VAEEVEWKKHKHGASPVKGFGTLPAKWAAERASLVASLDKLKAGKVAIFPEGKTALHVALGDFLGIAGKMGSGAPGIHFEVFSRDLIGSDFKSFKVDPSGPFYEKAPAGVTEFLEKQAKGGVKHYRVMMNDDKAALFQRMALRFRSEWSLVEADFPQGEWAAAKAHMWWREVASGFPADTPKASKLPEDGKVWHYHPLGFMSWLNAITWKSEWPKYRIVDAAGAKVPAPARPPSRR
jgi:hypothetical protein